MPVFGAGDVALLKPRTALYVMVRCGWQAWKRYHVQAMLEAFVQSGPSAPVAGLPVMSEMLRRVADLDEEEADMLRSLGTAKPQVCPPHADKRLCVDLRA